MAPDDVTPAPSAGVSEKNRVKPESAQKEAPTNPEGASGLINSIRMIFGLCLAILHSRLDLFATELEEERRRLFRGAVLGGVLVVALVGTLFCSMLFVIVLAWMFKVLLLLLGVTIIVLSLTSLIMVFKLRALYSQREKFFHYTLEELRKDIVGLRRAMGAKKGA